MNAQPERSTTAGTAYLDLRRLAKETHRATDELLQLYALEGFLDRLTHSEHAETLVLKRGVLLAAYDIRRPTRDIDFAATDIGGDLADLQAMTNNILAIDRNDGLAFDLSATTVAAIREDDSYPSARVKISGTLSTARIRFHIDINIGDPLWPEPHQVEIPRLLGGEPLRLTGYRVELVLAEKIVTAVQRGTAKTRWRDFVDIARLVDHELDSDALAESIRRVSDHRQTELQLLSDVLEGYADLAQARWAAWRRKQRLTDTPEDFSELLATVTAFSDPYLETTLPPLPR